MNTAIFFLSGSYYLPASYDPYIHTYIPDLDQFWEAGRDAASVYIYTVDENGILVINVVSHAPLFEKIRSKSSISSSVERIGAVNAVDACCL